MAQPGRPSQELVREILWMQVLHPVKFMLAGKINRTVFFQVPIAEIDNALDPVEVRDRLSATKDLEDVCSMCDKLCAMKVFS